MSICTNCIHKIVCDHESKYRKSCSQFLEARPHGKWIDHKDYSFSFCNVCGMGNNVTGGYKSNFCPNCGASMSANDERYIHECLSLLKNIQDCGDCNVCASKKNCQYAPKLGQMVRYNCPFYKKESDGIDISQVVVDE